MLSFSVITTSCITTEQNEVVLPPRPEREEIPQIRTIEDCAYVINYYEHLVQKWESWGNSVIDIVENPR